VRAAAVRPTIAPRDFYDLWYIFDSGFDFRDEDFRALVLKKLEEDGFSSELEEYRVNLGRRKEEIDDMESRIEHELLSVLSAGKRQEFSFRAMISVCGRVFE
jgi:hypothetical protein